MTMSRARILVSSTLLALAAAACDSSAPATPDAHIGSGSDPTPDAKIDPTPSTFVSNTPGATLVDVGVPATTDLALISSNLVQKPSGNQYFQQWYGELQNKGSKLACLTSIDLGFQDASGATLASFHTFANGDPYMSDGGTVTSPCIKPGQIAGIYTNAFAPSSVAIASTRTITVKYGPHDFPAYKAVTNAPRVDATVIPYGQGESALMGTLTGQGSTIYNIGVDFYPRDATGLVVAELHATDLETLTVGGTFAFTTLGAAPFTQYRASTSFINGAKPFTGAVAHKLSGLAAEQVQDRADVWARDRAAAAR